MPQPVYVFLQQSLTLKTAIAECLRTPTPKRVHRLRTTTRRIEATIELLILSVDLSGLNKRSKPLRRYLSKLRRAAGKVRDCDVHHDLLKAFGRTPDTRELFDYLATVRQKAERDLLRLLEQEQDRVERTLDEFAARVDAARELSLSGTKLIILTRKWFAGAVRGLDLTQDDDLHTLRKAAKTARYLAETGKDISKAAATLASHFEAAQKTLGEWHDHLLLLDEAKANLPADSKTTLRIQEETKELRSRADSAAKRLLPTV